MRWLWRNAKEYRRYCDRLGVLTFQNMRTVPGLQAADLLAYELRHYYHLRDTRPDLRIRYPFKRILAHQERMHARRLHYISPWALHFQAAGIYSAAISAMADLPEAFESTLNELLPEGKRVLDGLEMMQRLETIVPYPISDEVDKKILLKRAPEFVEGKRRSLWPYLASTNWKN